jgi:hypothetical protein
MFWGANVDDRGRPVNGVRFNVPEDFGGIAIEDVEKLLEFHGASVEFFDENNLLAAQ